VPYGAGRYAAAAVAPLLAKYHLIARDIPFYGLGMKQKRRMVIADWPAAHISDAPHISDISTISRDWLSTARSPQLKMLTAMKSPRSHFLRPRARSDRRCSLINYLRTGTA
jgi:hypothetical protein